MNCRKMLVAIAGLTACVDQNDNTSEIESYSFVSQNMQYDLFGSAVAVADFNGDSVLDVAIGSPGESDDVNSHDYGAVYTYYGTPGGGLTRGQKLEGMNFGGFDKQTTGAFGSALAVGDFNGDNHTDLAVGAPSSVIDGFNGAGAVFLYLGSSSGLSVHRVITACGESFPDCERASRFGAAVAAGPIVDNRYDSIVIGAPRTQVEVFFPITGWTFQDAGAVYVVHRPGEGFKGTLLKGTFDEEELGATLAVGDLDSDGHADIAVGAPGFASDAGRVMLYAGRRPPETQPTLWSAMATFKSSIERTAQADGDRFGQALVIADLDPGNANRELAVGAPGVGSDAGVATVYAVSIGWDHSSEWSLSGSTGAALGTALAAGHLTSNQFGEDLVVGSPGYGGYGRVSVYSGTTLVTTRTQSQLHASFPSETGDNFGRTLATAGNKLAIGAPYEDPEIWNGSAYVDDGTFAAGAIDWVTGGSGTLASAIFVRQEASP